MTVRARLVLLALLWPLAAHAQTEPAAPAKDAVAVAPAKAASARQPRPATAAGNATTVGPAGTAPQRRAPAEVPLDARTAVLGALDKRTGSTAEFTLKPGERFSFGRLDGILRSCERTQPFEQLQSAAFVQVVEQPRVLEGQAKAATKTVFSGWLFAESPSLNPFVHPVYDVWLKSCTMTFPDGPKALAAGKASEAGKAPRRAPARKPSAAPEAAPSVTAPPVAAPAAGPAT